MKRRTFIQAVVGLVSGLLGIQGQHADESQHLSRQWEWDIRDWRCEWRRGISGKHDVREWEAEVDLLPAEVMEIALHVKAVTSKNFCVSFARFVQLQSITCNGSRDGLIRATVTLVEQSYNYDTHTVSGKEILRCERNIPTGHPLADFNELFRGKHFVKPLTFSRSEKSPEYA